MSSRSAVAESASVVVQGGRAAEALFAAAALATAAIVGALAPLVGVVRASDGSALWFAPGALWVGLLPAAVVAVLALRRPVVALAFAAGAGVVGIARFLADLPVVTAPDALARPDLFVETTDRALPLHAAAGGFVLLAADLIAVAGGVYAAVRLSGRVSLSWPEPSPSDRTRSGRVRSNRSGSDLPGTDPTPPSPSGPDASGPDPGGPDSGGPDPSGPGSSGPAESATAATDDFPDQRFAAFDHPSPGRAAQRRNYLLTAVGFVAVLLLAWGALSVPFQGGYLAARFVEAGVPLAGLIGAVLLVVLAATAVLVAGMLPRALAVGLLAGVALGACVPYLVAVASVPTAPVGLSDTVAIGLVGGVLLLVAGLLTRVGWQRVDGEIAPAASPRTVTVVAGAFGLAAGGLAAAATFLAPLDADGLEDVLSLADGSPVPGSLAFGAAALALFAAGLLTLMPATARAGRAVLLVLWATPVPALALALAVLEDGTIATARSVGLVAVGPGIWCGVTALVAACVSAVLAGIAAGRASAAEVVVPDDESVAAARAVTVPVAIGVGVLAVVSALLPVYGSAGRLQGPTILHTGQSWGTWVLLVVTLGAVGAAAVTRHSSVALALGVAAAVAQGMRLVVAFAVRDATGFALRPGAAVQAVLVLALLGAAAVLAVRAGRVQVTGLDDAERPRVRGGGVARTAADGASSDRTTPARPSGARPRPAARRRSSQNRRKRR